MKRLLAVLTLVAACDSPARQAGMAPGPGGAAPGAGLMGKELYAAQCSTCHGDQGRGDGRAAEFLFPSPRDFTTASYKLRSTASGEIPIDTDLLRVLERGIPGSAMPSFEFLTEPQRKSLVEYLKTFAMIEIDEEKKNLFETRANPRIIPLPPAPAQTPEILARGRQVYEAMACAKCHGPSGEGDGPSAPTLVDRWNRPIPPANFARGIFKGGDSVSDIYLRFTTGMNGTPMPSFEDSIPEADRWALAYYVKSIVRRDEKPLQHSSERVVTTARTRDVPIDPLSPEWSKATPTDVPLMTMWQRREAPNYMTVRGLRSDDHVAFLLEWSDATVDGTVQRPQDFSDAVAVMFSMTEPSGHFTMGEKGKPCNIWQWRFSRQLDLASFRDMETAYPNMVADDYSYAGSHYPKTERFPGHLPVTPAPSHDPTHLSGWGAGNSLSNPVPTTCVEDLNAEGFGTLTPQPPADQNVEGRGLWTAGRWKVVFRRTLTGGPKDSDFRSGATLHIAFAAWDGSAGDRDGKKSVTFWQILRLD